MAKTILVSIEGMTCGHCVSAVKKELQKVPGLESVSVEVGLASVQVSEETDEIKRAIENAVSEAGYKVSGFGRGNS